MLCPAAVTSCVAERAGGDELMQSETMKSERCAEGGGGYSDFIHAAVCFCSEMLEDLKRHCRCAGPDSGPGNENRDEDNQLMSGSMKTCCCHRHQQIDNEGQMTGRLHISVFVPQSWKSSRNSWTVCQLE